MCGYIAWNLIASLYHSRPLRLSFVAHAAIVVCTSHEAFQPFVNMLLPMLVMYEWSSPLYHLQWFMDKVVNPYSGWHLSNNIVLMALFTWCRLTLGVYWSAHTI
ncbi:hypothetical protein H4R35_004826, partial [Dimargaris xerosporica]